MKKRYYLLSFIICFISFSAVAQKLPSADAIIARYVQIIGGAKQWSAIKTSEFHATASVGDKALNLLVIKAGSGRYYETLKGEGIMAVTIYDSGKGITIASGIKKNMTDTMLLDHYQLQSCILPDMNYIQLNYKRQLLGIKDVNGIPCYQVSLTSKNGATNINYYEKKSGLLTMVEKNGVKTVLADYKFYKGCSIPYTMTTDLGEGYGMIVKVTDWLVNEKSSVELFDTKKQEMELE
jgi:hypothetical protein